MNFSIVLNTITLLCGSGILLKVFQIMNKFNDKLEAIAYGTKNSLKDRLLQSYRHAQKRGYMSFDEKEAWMDMYYAYHNLGANGVMDKYRDKILELPDGEEMK